VLADKGSAGAGEPVLTPYRARTKLPSQKAANSAHARLRAPAERANAQLIPEGAGQATRQGHPHPFKPAKSPDEERSLSKIFNIPQSEDDEGPLL
jgi:hypothetical protein